MAHHQIVNHVLNLSGLITLNITVNLIVEEVAGVTATGVRRRGDELDLDLTTSGVQSGMFKLLLDRTFQVLDYSLFTRAALLKRDQTNQTLPFQGMLFIGPKSFGFLNIFNLKLWIDFL